MASIRVTIVCDNVLTGISDLMGEHGFAAVIETPSGNYLFDTGQGHTILHNLARLKFLKSLDAVLISHGHYDHTGGLPQVLSCFPEGLPVYLHPQVFARRVTKKDGRRISSGIPYTRDHLERFGPQLIETIGWTQVGENLFLTGEIPRVHEFENAGSANRVLLVDGREEPDCLPDDQALVADTPEGLVVILGCCHSGLLNTLDFITAKMGTKTIRAVIGGTHLGLLSTEQAEETLARIGGYDVRHWCPCHCTGIPYASKISALKPEQFTWGGVGASLSF